MLQKTDIVRHTVTALCNGGKTIQNSGIHLAGIRLSTNIKTLCKSKVFSDFPVHLIDFSVVSFKKLHKTCLCSGCTTAPEKFDILNGKINFLQIRKEILHPKRRSFPYRYKLRRLVMCISECRNRFVFHCKI